MFFVIASFAASPLVMQQSFAQCFINEDWPQAPCLDNLINGCYDSDDVKTWMKYYDYKGKSFMESKKSEMIDAFEANRLSEWESQSSENFNVWQYYYLKGEIPDFAGGHYRCNSQFVPEVELLPSTKITYGDSFTIHAWLLDYEGKPENLRFYVDVVDSHSKQVDSTLWFARQDFVYEFDTTHQSYNITKGGAYKVKLEHANQMQRTGFIHKTLEFEIDFPDKHLYPLKQLKSGVIFDEIQCRENFVLILKHDNSPACVKPETKTKLMQRGWAIESTFYGLTKSQITDIQLAKMGCKKLGNQTYCDEMVQEKVERYLQQNELDAKSEPEPELMPESETSEKQRQAKLHVQEIMMTDYRDRTYHIDAINDYRNEFETGYFLEQFLYLKKQNYEKDDLINFILVEWGYQSQECTSPKVEVYLRPYENYESIEKISEWQKPDEECIPIDSDSDGYLIMNAWPMPGIFEPHETCSIPGEYRIITSNLKDESKKEWGYYTCQQEKLVGEPQPWMEFPS